jgi:Putative transposase
MTLGPCHAHVDGFDLHAGLVTRAGQRDRLERLCRYALRPALAQDRLHVTVPRGRSGSRCGIAGRTGRRPSTPPRTTRAPGAPTLRFDPLELLERLAVLTRGRGST